MTGHDVVVVGAGAAGLMAALEAARGGARVLVIEKTPRAGTKILASGGTHCNLTTTLEPRAAARLFGKQGERFLRGPFQALSPKALREAFSDWGVPTRSAPLEKIFPVSGRARDVRDALLQVTLAAGAEVRYDTPLLELVQQEGSGSSWTLRCPGDEDLEASAVILAAGGKSYPRTGTTGDGYGWLQSLGLPLVEPRPSLVPLRSNAHWVQELAGVSLPDCELFLQQAKGEPAARRRRPLLFTHRGLSGPGPMDLSGRISALGDHAQVDLRADLLPDIDRESLRDELLALAAQPGRPGATRLLKGKVPRRLLGPICAACDIGPDMAAAALTRAQRHGLIEAIKRLPLPVEGTLGYDQAEVTAGGLALDALDSRTMQVHGHEGLFVCGELLDLDGPIGGLNFQAAFSTGYMAGRAAARSFTGK
ncbi:MAG TPA: aminoacetone oxidase family FAD-binding enzyme [Planctomycetes bacterium]|nr:aminoacetone oxidase family FAD-binding enzyme [Planctomycetota bacterium]HIK59098.1 aminoacetone oxidase family FAD-binding enzyme [Planctomycetota bacterium]